MSLKNYDRSTDGPQWIALYITHNLQEAHVIMGVLRAHDVPAMIHQEAGATALGITFGNLGEVKVLVSPTDYDRAASLLFPATDERIEANNDKIQLIWRDDDSVENSANDVDE